MTDRSNDWSDAIVGWWNARTCTLPDEPLSDTVDLDTLVCFADEPELADAFMDAARRIRDQQRKDNQ